MITGKQYWPKIMGATLVLAGLSAAFEYRTIWLLFFTDFVPHRVEWRPFGSGSFADFLYVFKENILFGQYHFASGQFPVQLVTILTALILIFWSAREGKIDVSSRLFLWLVGFSLIISVVYASEESGLSKFSFWFPIPFFISRFNVFHTLLLPVIFSLAVAGICLRFAKFSAVIAISITVLAVLQAILAAHSLGPKVVKFLGPTFGNLFGISPCGLLQNAAQCSQTNMLRYYRSNEFREIARQIGRPLSTYWVASMDIDPMIAAFNGYQTIDGYSALYSVDYKHKFESIIAKELDRDPATSDYFRKWGSRVYLFHRAKVPPLIDFCEALNVGANYILTPSNLVGIDTLALVATSGDLKAYEIVNCHR
jgi:Protein of unknown function (DUF6044)